MSIRVNSLEEYEAVFRSHYAGLVSYAFGFLNDHDEAEDVTQEVFIKVWERRDSIELKSGWGVYLRVAVRNASVNRLKSKYRQMMSEELQEFREPAELETSDLDLADLETLANSILSQLPEKTGIIFRMSRFSNASYEEIAKELGLSVKSVEYHMSKAIQWIKKNLSKHWYMVWLLMGMIKK
ncbi:RNA polymerase sigma-70 factor (plasmid) [Fulvitalea axinellae]|uniref:RNA polymerase sigma-70 factor n=1 Tax=Fulvitalea axinellae TaxID=1182444 RepID=A0AAU9CZ96_9BACT|nr:RNA polymerase sigma-70 factor [Fulvitalea axinellae]